MTIPMLVLNLGRCADRNQTSAIRSKRRARVARGALWSLVAFAAGCGTSGGADAPPASGGNAGMGASAGMPSLSSGGGGTSGGGGPGISGGSPGAAGGSTPGGGASGASGVSGGAAAAGKTGGAGAGAGGNGPDGAGGALGGSAGRAASGGSGGAVGLAGSSNGGSAGTPNGDDLLPPRPLGVTVAKARHEHTFRAKTADSAVSFNDNTEIAVIDNRATTLMGKLVLPFGGKGTNQGALGGSGEFCARRGFHVLAIATFQDYDIVLGDAAFYGDARRQVFEGVEHTRKGEFANITMTVADGVARRTQKALQYLHAQFPTEDWGYYLQADGSVRWSDVIFSGMSHGASNAARFGMLVRAARVVSSAGPRDNACTRVDLANCGGVVATWFDEKPKTPIDRFYAITGNTDEQHTQHLFAMEKLGYVGKATNVNSAQPPYGQSHRLVANSGHTDFCGVASYQNACNYLFGVPSENQQGTAP